MSADDTNCAISGASGTTCPACGKPGGPWEVDHKHPRSRGGMNTAVNKWVICRDCNRTKGSMTLYEFQVHQKSSNKVNPQ